MGAIKRRLRKESLICLQCRRLRSTPCGDSGSSGVHPPSAELRGIVGTNIVDVTTLKREHPYGFKRNKFFIPELDVINKAAYWDYQRDRVFVKSIRPPWRTSTLDADPRKHWHRTPPLSVLDRAVVRNARRRSSLSIESTLRPFSISNSCDMGLRDGSLVTGFTATYAKAATPFSNPK